jgi:hypothetical protein
MEKEEKKKETSVSMNPIQEERRMNSFPERES